jgi:PAS domain S-box-containing protein
LNTAYLLFFPLTVLPALMAYVFSQNPRAPANRLFALYMLDLALLCIASLMVATTPDATLAGAAMVTLFITNYVLNGFFMTSVALFQFFPPSLLRRYGFLLLLVIATILSAIVLSDGILRTGVFYVAGPELGQGYQKPATFMVGAAGLLLRLWLFFTMGVAILLLVVAWIRARRGERGPISSLIAAIAVIAVAMPLLPSSPVNLAIPALLFPVVFSLVVGRYRLLLPTQAAAEAVYRSTTSALITSDMHGQIVQANPAAERLLGMAAKEILGRPITEALAPLLAHARQEGGERNLAEAIAQGMPDPVEVLLRVEEPTAIVLTVAGIPLLDEHNRRLGFVLSMRDVTVQQHAQQALEERARLAEMIRELSSPIIPVLEEVLILPLVGTIDSERAQQVMDAMLEAIRRHRARALLIDITGVPVVDTMVANYLLQAVRAAGLLGCQGILVGIRAEVARTMIGLGLNLSGLVTKATLQDGLEYATELVGAGSPPGGK